jgi:hypothetical protein
LQGSPAHYGNELSVNRLADVGVLVGVLRLWVVLALLVGGTGCASEASIHAASTSALASPGSRLPSGGPAAAVASAVPSGATTYLIKTQRWTGKQGTVGTRVDFAATIPTKIRAAPSCRIGDLELVPQGGAGMGSDYASIHVRNRSGTVCSVYGTPHLALLDDKGVTWNSTGRDPLSSQRPTTVVLVPNSWARVGPLLLGNSCGGYGRTTTLRVTMPSGEGTSTISWIVGTAGPDRCIEDGPQKPPAPHPASLPQVPFAATEPLNNADALGEQDRRIDLHVPTTVRRGDLLHYTVQVSPVHLYGAPLWDPTCPLFRQTLDRTGPTYELNCRVAPFLDAGEAVAFQMQILVPADAPLGQATLSWQLVEPEQDPITATLSITD